MIELTDLTKAYGRGNQRTVVLDAINFRVDAGEILAVVGPSGAGKSTLAQCINLLTPPTSGSVVNGEDLTTLSARQLRVARRRIGTVFQSAGLLERRTAAENVALPLEYPGVTADESKKRVAELLDRVGLSQRADHYPFQLSGVQRQRVGIARALALRPSVLLSDEATAGLAHPRRRRPEHRAGSAQPFRLREPAAAGRHCRPAPPLRRRGAARRQDRQRPVRARRRNGRGGDHDAATHRRRIPDRRRQVLLHRLAVCRHTRGAHATGRSGRHQRSGRG